MARLAWRRTGSSTYEADLIDRRTAKVTAQQVDDRDYDGGARRTLWWAWLGGDPLPFGPWPTKTEAVDAVESHAGPIAPGDWLVLDMDDGVLRACGTRSQALKWFMDFSAANRVLSRHRYGPGRYEYVVAGADTRDSRHGFIEVAWMAARFGGWDATQAPLYPYPDRPFDHEPRRPG